MRILIRMPDRGSPSNLSPEELVAWQGFLRTNTRIVRLLDLDLRREGLSENRYDVLIQLGLAPRRRLRMTTLAQEVLMSPSGLSRLVDELEADGLVIRERRDDDARSYEVVLTPAGRSRLRTANRSHLQRVRELFLDQLTDDQLQQLSEIWEAVRPAAAADDARNA